MPDMYSKRFGNGLETRRLYAEAFNAVVERLRENANLFFKTLDSQQKNLTFYLSLSTITLD